MAKQSLHQGVTSKAVALFVQDTTRSDGGGLTGLVFNTPSLTAYYWREGAVSATALVLVSGTVGTWTSSGFVEVDPTNLPGVYQLGLPNAAVAGGATWVVGLLKGAANMAAVPFELRLTGADFDNATSLGLSNLDAAISSRQPSGPVSLVANAVDAAQFTQGAADKVWTSAVRTLTSFGTLVADIATAVWTSATRTLTSFGTLVADTATAVWSYPSRTLTSGSAAPPLVIANGNFEFLRGDSISISITGLPSLVSRTKLWFTMKDNVDNADAAALIQIQEGVGLVTLNGAPGTAGQGSLVVTNAGAGNVTITLAAVASAALARNVAGTYDIQMLVGTTVTTLAMGTFTMTADITRAVS